MITETHDTTGTWAKISKWSIITVVLAGDKRLNDKFRTRELQPLGSRIRTRLSTEPASRDELMTFLIEAMTKAGNQNLMTKDLAKILVDHAAGNFRVLMIMAGELLAEGVSKEKHQLDEQLFFDLFSPHKRKSKN